MENITYTNFKKMIKFNGFLSFTSLVDDNITLFFQKYNLKRKEYYYKEINNLTLNFDNHKCYNLYLKICRTNKLKTILND